MNIKIFKKDNSKEEIKDGVLYEGVSYLLDLKMLTPDEREAYISQSRIDKYLSYYKENPFASIKFINVVGFVNLFGTTVDVRSSKLFEGQKGQEQFNSLLKDLVDISSRMTFINSGVASAKRIVEFDNYDPNEIERFDYFYQFTFEFPVGSNLDSLLSQVLNQPNNITTSNIEKTPISKSKNLSKGFSRQISRSKSFGIINEEHSLAKTALVIKLKSISGKNYLPVYVDDVKKKESFDTVENRFVKFLLEEIKTLCLRLTQYINDRIFIGKINELSKKVDYYLRHPFFKDIGRLNYLPDSSSVLLNKAGYRELYFHFIQSKFGFQSIMEELTKISMKAGLKNIAKLYEIWVFFKIGSLLFKEDKIKQTFPNRSIKDGDCIREIVWSNQSMKLSFNASFNRPQSSSYSLNLRPDISLKINGKLFLFDAKYKFKTKPKKDGKEEIQQWVKSEDVHKMHAYLDAIKKASCSIAVYPGTDFVFYNKENFAMSKNAKNLNYSGVGAIPLVPCKGSEELNTFILGLVELVKSSNADKVVYEMKKKMRVAAEPDASA